jgi:small-conductance mechanosensitive channel
MQPITTVTHLMNGIDIYAVVKALILLISGYFIAKLISTGLVKALARLTPQYSLRWVSRISFYLTFILFFLVALQHLGFKLNALLGAAGVVTVALSFASQTSVSNIISGLFLIAEKPFVVGDSIQVENTTGQVLGIDLLSTKIRTADNTMVRIPNESLIKSNIINLTRFPIRRFNLQLGIAYKEDLENVRKILLEVANKNPLCLAEPQPAVTFVEFANSAINLQLTVWATQQTYTELKNGILEQVKVAFEENNIEMPFPQLALSTASMTEPFPVNVIPSAARDLHK